MLTSPQVIIPAAIVLLALLVVLAYPAIRGNTKEQLASIDQADLSNPQPKRLRGEAYHEVIVLYRYFNQIKAGVYSDTGEPLISDDVFARMDVDEIRKELGAMAVLKNGPRFYVVDEITGYRMGAERNIGGHRMTQPGVVKLTFGHLLKRSPYTVKEVNRKTTYLFKKGEKVYELANPQNEVFTMQAASREIDKGLEIGDLDNLAARLNLPEGWKYRVRLLEADVKYEVADIAYVIQDDLQNTYQKNP